MGSTYGINLPRTMKIIFIDVAWKGIGCIHVVCSNNCKALPSIDERKRTRDKNELL